MIIQKDLQEILKRNKERLNIIKAHAVNQIFDLLQEKDIYQEYTTMELIELSEEILYKLSK